MDYDGNDFQSQNFQLSGEDNNRFSSGLRSYSLPKFELDEQFQVHLRFDSLGEPESLLGIQDQEENSWIEDFSSGNSALEFTRSAADSCSISRRKNVWSEATSSESVEILLRSVGEDDLINKEATIFDLGSHNGLSSEVNQMDSSSIPDVSLQSTDTKADNAHAALLPDKLEKDLSSVAKSVASDLPDTVQEMSKSLHDEELKSALFVELDEGGKGSTCSELNDQCNLTEIITLSNIESLENNKKSCDYRPIGKDLIDHHFGDGFMQKNVANDLVTSPTLVAEGSQNAIRDQIDPSTSTPEISSIDSQKLSVKEISYQATESDHVAVSTVMSQQMAMDDKHNMGLGTAIVNSSSKNEPSKACINQNLDILDSSSSLDSKADTSSLLMEECNKHILSEKSDGLLEDVAHQIEVLSKGNVMSGQILTTSHEALSLVIGSETDVGRESAKVCSFDNSQQSASLENDFSEQARGVSADVCFGSRVTSENNDAQVGNELEGKLGSVDCGELELDKHAAIAEGNIGVQSHPSEGGKKSENSDPPVEFETKGTDCAQVVKEKEDDLGIKPLECVSHFPEPSIIEKNANDEAHENAGDTPDASGKILQKNANPPNLHDDHCENVQISPLQDATSAEEITITDEAKVDSSGIHPENLESNMKMKPQDAPTQCQNTQTEADHMDIPPAGDVTPERQGNAVSSKENSLQSVSFPSSFSDHLSEVREGDPTCLEQRCGSPIVISSSQCSSGDVPKQELVKQLSDPTTPVSNDLPQASDTCKNSNEIASTSNDAKGSLSEERSFTFEVGSLADASEKASLGAWKPFPLVQSYELPQAKERCSPVPGLKQSNPGSLIGNPDTGKITPRDKSRSASGTERSSTSKRKLAKATPMVKEATEKDKSLSNNQSASIVSTVSKGTHLEENSKFSYSEGGVKSTSVSSIQISKLPDLNSGTTLFQQPFTDLQQVQLRAQIFVYGSLIQGIPPDEAYMISAFGNADGTRSTWDGIWRITLERFHSQKTQTTNLDSPLQPHSGFRIAEQASRSSPLPTKPYISPVSRTNGKSSSTVISSFMSVPSPLWGVSSHEISQSNMSRGVNVDPSHMLSPLQGYQSSHGKQYGSVNPWLSQVSPIPWLATSQSSPLDARMHFLPQPAAETVQVTPARDLSILQNSNMQFLAPFSTPGIVSTSSAIATVPAETPNTVPSQPENHASGTQKTRKRRKNIVSDAPAQIPLASQPSTQLDSGAAVTKQLPISMSSVPAIPSSMSQTHFQIIGSHGKDQKVIFSEETSSKIEHARLQAEDASAFAASAIRHMEGIWGQLAIQRNSAVGSEIETKLASAAVAAAAAASVARAAAAAAKVASDAALQAKMMVDETLLNRVGNSIQGSQPVQTNVPKLTPSAKGKDKTNNSSSVISAAKEAARKRVEAASAASKRAENLDAIVKAAELAALAVCQAGAVIAMGDPLPFTLHDLIDAGPESYWKAQHPPAETAITDTQGNQTAHKESLQRKNSKSMDVDHHEQGIDDGNKFSGNELRLKEKKSAPEYNKNHKVASLKEKPIQEGSVVEVCVYEENPPRRVWCLAKVLTLEDSKAYVSSSDFYSIAGTGVKDWISLLGEDDKPPRIRIPHPTIAVKFDGTRKRRRSALCNYTWAIGDHVDAWIRECWCEGVVTDKSKEDETKLTVCFSAGGDSSMVSAWHLRPSLIWKDGHWVEWSRPREDTLHLHEVDTPHEKRHKSSKLEKESEHKEQNLGSDKPSSDIQVNYGSKPEESRSLLLTESDKIFSLGKNPNEESNQGAFRTKQIGQKEGSRVVFGVPKPGKKRKFMEVSKHYVTGKTNNSSEGGDIAKHSKYSTPLAAGGWKNSLRGIPKSRKGADSRPRVIKPAKAQATQIKSVTEREGSLLSSISTSNGVGLSQCPLPSVRSLNSHEEKSEKAILESTSFTNNIMREENTVSEASMRSLPGTSTSRKKAILTTESNVGTKGKVAFLEKTRSEEKNSNFADQMGKAIADTSDLRRSSRRIQPTSRLLEGLQSSMIISKIPSVPHEKGVRASHRQLPASKGNIHG